MQVILSTAAIIAGSLHLQQVQSTPIRRATEDGISSCGDAWMPRENVQIAQGTDERRGYQSAVEDFCSKADGQTVEAGGYLSLATEVFLNGGKNPSEYGVVGFVNFEVHNKIDSDHVIEASKCEEYLLALSAEGGKCSGSDNPDTKGGTWQVGKEDISYHALGGELPPQQDALNKLFTGEAIKSQSANHGDGAPLNPWPFDSLNDVKPTNCHSHNDYDRDVPVWSALSAGCLAIEADVFFSDNDVIIGHDSPTKGRTLRVQYVDPLRAILDHNNGGEPGSNGIYASSPEQSVVLMVDFKSSDTATLDALVSSLEPLREGGYLSRLEDGSFVQKQITIVASGNAPFDRIASGDGVPDRDVFYDAKLDNFEDKYSAENSYYASADFKSIVGSPGDEGSFSDEQKDKVREQVQLVHDAGLKVRYWNLPGEWIWESLNELGVDYLNADDMYNTARLPRV